ncbi:hypothetical protein GWI33_007910 [Rhynchophorus ferrugineus]|uniref:Uncharacterized protein n=1 Tax=Rhynchophorus ferrugineus TaxID=354439 RepID=A0A834IS27_RHYFE|nr:hypothetical protein GWI33_007910 [Rhynchophorus ferrugineus]
MSSWSAKITEICSGNSHLLSPIICDLSTVGKHVTVDALTLVDHYEPRRQSLMNYPGLEGTFNGRHFGADTSLTRQAASDNGEWIKIDCERVWYGRLAES